jgi:L-glutamine-phosphate cytidylyltransferase
MKLIILAAGKGERLLPLTRNTPKSLLEIGNGLTVLENQLETIGENGINKIVIVTGYKSEQIEAKIKDYNNFDIKIVYNPFYDISNNLVSAWMARYEMTDDFIIINGDVIFNSNVIKGLLNANTDICIAINKKEQYDEEDMKVKINDGVISSISKEIPIDEADGESIGMIKFRTKGKARLISTLDNLVRNKKFVMAFLPAAIQRIIEEGYTVNFFQSSPDDSAEIDFHPDLEAVKTNLDKYCTKIMKWGIYKHN